MAGDGICIFCGAKGTMTGEDVLGRWLQRIDLDQSPVPHRVGWLNRIGRNIGIRPPYKQRVRDVCKACNTGWMSRLETKASRVLTPFILGTPGVVEGHDLASIATWAQKTSLTAMYISTAADRAEGYGLPAAEYRELYEIRHAQEPLPRSQFWIGRFSGAMAWSVRVTPLVAEVNELPEPQFPHGYLMTIVLGQLLLQGIRMTTPGLEVTVSALQGMPQIWPDAGIVGWPEGDPVDDNRYQAFALGRDLLVQEPHISLHPWKPATELRASKLRGDLVEFPTACGKHLAHYPSVLISEAMNGRFYAFVVSCDCGIAYLIYTEPDGAHCKAGSDPFDIVEQYGRLSGRENTFTSGSVAFKCKSVP